MTLHAECLVIGAGVIGCSIALQLQRAGKSVLLLDAIAPGAGASAGNAGMVGANAVVPMVTPTFLRQLPALLIGHKRSVLFRPHALPAAFIWLLQCQKMANLKQLERSQYALHALHQHTLEEWQSLLGDAAWRRLFHVGSTVSQHPSDSVSHPMKALTVALRQQVHVATRLLSKVEISRGLPLLAADDHLFTAVDNTAAVQNSRELLSELIARFIIAGGRYQQQKVIGFAICTGQINHLNTANGKLRAQHYIVAAGSKSTALLPPSKLSLPLMPERGYHIMLKRTQPLFHGEVCVLHDAAAKRVITEMADGIRVTGYVEYVSPDQSARSKCYDQLEQHFRRRFPSYPTQRIGEWFGHRPSTPDSLPYIDTHPNAANLICAFGHGHYGMSGAPATARLVRDMVLSQADPAELAPFSLQRFSSRHQEESS